MEKTYMDERMLLDGLFAFLDQSVSPGCPGAGWPAGM